MIGVSCVRGRTDPLLYTGEKALIQSDGVGQLLAGRNPRSFRADARRPSAEGEEDAKTWQQQLKRGLWLPI